MNLIDCFIDKIIKYNQQAASLNEQLIEQGLICQQKILALLVLRKLLLLQ
jgi:hypothetical protein